MDSPSTRLLQTHTDVRSGQRLLTLGVAPELAADWAISARIGGGQVWAVADDLCETQATERLAREEHLSALHPLHSADLSELPAQPFDACAVDILGYPSRAYLHRLIYEAARRLEPGGAGALWIAGANDAGIHALEKRLREVWGEVSVLAYKKGHRILHVPRPAELAPLDEAAPEERRLTLRGEKFSLALRPGVFAGGDLDPATRLLANEMEVGDSKAILDLGCGSGILGMLAARLVPHSQVYLTDSSAVALAAAEENCRRSGLTNTRVLASDGVAAVSDQRFDLVLCNPPFHQQRSHSSITALRFIREVGGILAPRGRFYLVASQFLRYEPAMREAFGSVTTIANDRKYKVLLAVGFLAHQ
ncbi:MAG TPA: methyltransferase [Ktedonobacterales bacterium]|jgi:16S rRNA (guanine1207-N2)-methyltransferase